LTGDASDRRPPSDLGVYGISVAAELVDNAQEDLDRLREIGRLLDGGLNLAGIAMVLALQDANHALQARLDQIKQDP
jgi:MerR family transcriptional regulator/heat shock protein HspR